MYAPLYRGGEFGWCGGVVVVMVMVFIIITTIYISIHPFKTSTYLPVKLLSPKIALFSSTSEAARRLVSSFLSEERGREARWQHKVK
jgi:uncharacterized protein (UPF0333 family)